MEVEVPSMSQEIVQAIRSAFPAGTPPERPVTSHRCHECDEVDELLGGQTWIAIADDFPGYCHDAFPLLTASAKAYYLPTYLVAVAEDAGGMQSISVEFALRDGELSPTDFTAAQRAAIRQTIIAHWKFEGSNPDEAILAAWQ
jgi:hypothetical protein